MKQTYFHFYLSSTQESTFKVKKKITLKGNKSLLKDFVMLGSKHEVTKVIFHSRNDPTHTLRFTILFGYKTGFSSL